MVKCGSISAVVLTKNEEVNIRRCLASLPWVDDLFVVDCGSEDNTVAIATEMGAYVVIHCPEVFLISEQRNWALDNLEISTEWVLFLDADEAVTPKLKTAIEDAIKNAPPDVAGFQMRPKNIFLGRWLRHVIPDPAWHDRLVRLGHARFKGGVWESFETRGRIWRIREPYLHYVFSHGLTGWLEKHQRYAKWKALKYLEGNEETSSANAIKMFLRGNPRPLYRKLERAAMRFGWISPLMRFIYHYVLLGGFLDGLPGLIYSMLLAMYQLMIYVNVLEEIHIRKNLSL